MSDVAKEYIEKERAERRKFWRQYDEPEAIVPKYVQSVAPGSVCRLWFMPNQSPFVVVGIRADGVVTVVLEGGRVQGFEANALVVVVDTPPPDWQPLQPLIEQFEATMKRMAWGSRCGKVGASCPSN